MAVTSLVVRGAGAGAGDPVAAWGANNSTASHVQTPSFAGAGNQLVLHIASMGSYFAPLMPLVALRLLSHGDNDSNLCQTVSHHFHQPAGMIPGFDLLNSYGGQGHTVLSIAIDAGSVPGNVCAVLPPAETLAPCFWGSGYSGGSFHGSTPVDPTLGPGGLGEIEPGQETTFLSPGGGVYTPYFGLNDSPRRPRPLMGRYNLASTIYYDRPMVHGIPLSAPRDLSGRVLSCCVANAGYYSLNRYAVGGFYLGIQSGATPNGSRLWKLAAYDTIINPIEAIFPYQVGVDRAGYVADFGTLDSTQIEHLVWGVNARTTNGNASLAHVVALDTMRLVGGNAAEPCTFGDGEKQALEAGSLRTVQAHHRQGAQTFYVSQSFQVGGVAGWPTYFDSANQSIEFPARYDVDDRRVNCNVDPLAFTAYIGATDEDLAIYCRDGAWNMQGRRFEVVAGASRLVPDNFVGLSVIDAGEIRLRNIGQTGFAGLQFLQSPEVLYDPGTEMSGGVTVTQSTGAQAISIDSQAALDELANWAFEACPVGVTINGEHSALTFPAGRGFTDCPITVNYTGTTPLTLTVSADLGITQGNVAGNVTVESPSAVLTLRPIDLAGNEQSGGQLRIGDRETGDPQEMGSTLYYTASAQATEDYGHDGSTNVVRVMYIKPGFVEFGQDLTLDSNDRLFDIVLEAETNT